MLCYLALADKYTTFHHLFDAGTVDAPLYS